MRSEQVFDATALVGITTLLVEKRSALIGVGEIDRQREELLVVHWDPTVAGECSYSICFLLRKESRPHHKVIPGRKPLPDAAPRESALGTIRGPTFPVPVGSTSAAAARLAPLRYPNAAADREYY